MSYLNGSDFLYDYIEASLDINGDLVLVPEVILNSIDDRYAVTYSFLDEPSDVEELG